MMRRIHAQCIRVQWHCLKCFKCLLSTKKHEMMRRIHAPCIRVRGRCFKCFKCLLSTKNTRWCGEYTRRVCGCGRDVLNVYCPPKTRDDTVNTRAVHSGAGSVFQMFTVHQKLEKIQRIHAPCIRVRGHYFKCLLSTKNKRRYNEYTRRVFGYGDIVLNVSNVLYCPPKTRENTANTRAVYSGAGTLF